MTKSVASKVKKGSIYYVKSLSKCFFVLTARSNFTLCLLSTLSLFQFAGEEPFHGALLHSALNESYSIVRA